MSAFMHDYHVSIVEIGYHPTKGKIEISQKLFVDDFEKALMLDGQLIHLEKELNNSPSKDIIIQYLNKHFSLSTNEEEIELQFVGAEWEDYHAFYVYWESTVPSNLQTLTINNDVFLEVSTDHQNMHYIQSGKKKISLLLQDGKTTGLVHL